MPKPDGLNSEGHEGLVGSSGSPQKQSTASSSVYLRPSMISSIKLSSYLSHVQHLMKKEEVFFIKFESVTTKQQKIKAHF